MSIRPKIMSTSNTQISAFAIFFPYKFIRTVVKMFNEKMSCFYYFDYRNIIKGLENQAVIIKSSKPLTSASLEGRSFHLIWRKFIHKSRPSNSRSR